MKKISFTLGLFALIFAFAGCSAVDEGTIAFNLDLSPLFSENQSLRSASRDAASDCMVATASVCEMSENKHDPDSGQTHGNDHFESFGQSVKVSYPNLSAGFEFRGLKVGKTYSVDVNIHQDDYWLAGGGTKLKLRSGLNTAVIQITREKHKTVTLQVNLGDVGIPDSSNKNYHRYILFYLNNGDLLQNSGKGTDYYGLEEVEGADQDIKHSFGGYTSLTKTTAQVFYIITANKVSWAGKDSNGYINKESTDSAYTALKYAVLRESKKQAYFVPNDNNTLELSFLEPGTYTATVGTTTLAKPEISYVANGCEVAEPTTDSPYKVRNFQSAETSGPSIEFTADGQYGPDTTYEWFLNGSSVSSSDSSYELSLSENTIIHTGETNTLMVIVKSGGELQSAIWQFTVE